MVITRPDWRESLEGPSRGLPVSQCDSKACACVKLRTSLERNAPESLTPELYDFVHGDIWRAVAAQAQDGVAGPRFKCDLAPLKVNANVDACEAEESRGHYWVFMPLAPAWIGVETNSVASSTAWPMGVGPCARIGTRTRVPATGASQTSMSRCLARYLIAVRVGTKPATGVKYAAQTTTGPE